MSLNEYAVGSNRWAKEWLDQLALNAIIALVLGTIISIPLYYLLGAAEIHFPLIHVIEGLLWTQFGFFAAGALFAAVSDGAGASSQTSRPMRQWFTDWWWTLPNVAGQVAATGIPIGVIWLVARVVVL